MNKIIGNLMIVGAFVFLFVASYIESTYTVVMGDYGFPLFVCYVFIFSGLFTQGIMKKLDWDD